MTEDLAIGSVRAEVTDEAIVVRVELSNDSDRTLHAYRDARSVRYDAATGLLRVGLTDRAGEPTQASTYVLPGFTAIDPHSSTTIDVRLPAVLTRISGVNAQGAPVIERVPIHEATEVVVEVGWSDSPFYRDTRVSPEGAHPARQLVNWERGLATARAPLVRNQG